MADQKAFSCASHFLPSLPLLSLSSSPSPISVHSLRPHQSHGSMSRRQKPYSKKEENVRTSRISSLPPRLARSARQRLPNGGTHHPSSLPPGENEPHPSPFPPSMQTRGGDLDITEPNIGAHNSPPPSFPTEHYSRNSNMTSLTSGSSPFPSETHRLPPVDRTHGSSPHAETRAGHLNIKTPTTATHTPSSPPPAEPHAIPATSTGTSLLHGARDFIMNNSVINVQGDSNDRDIIIQGMRALSNRVIKGAEYDSSLRDPPPQCHPGTRVELVKKILAWFRNREREKALLWLSGPAGVGKSAVIQTVAESLAESKSVGATLFFSRLNNRNDPQRVFITLAFQLSIRISAYRNYITERIDLDPSLLGKGVKEQFRIFITEPFGINGIGKGEGPWAVLLDGLDECEGVNEQSRIVKLVSEFILRFPNAPLIWVVASRPEPHIVATFNNPTVTPSYWSEYVPIDSTQSCRDVEHYLDASFKAMHEQFPHLPPTWPRESQFLKLSNGAQGLFVFARTAVYFMEDPNYTDPVSRLNLILSIIDGLDIKLIDDHPFAVLDALYTQILTSIPLSVWPTTKRLLGFVICVRRFSGGDVNSGLSYPLSGESRSLMGASIIHGVELSVAYGSLHKLHSVLKIPDPKEAHESMATFLHASLGDYLVDRVRSKEFYIDRGEVVDEIGHCLFQLYLDKPWNTEWERYTPHPPTGSHLFVFLNINARSSLEYVLTGKHRSQRGRGPFKSQQDRLDCLHALSRINPLELLGSMSANEMATFMSELWNTFREEVESTGLFKEVRFRDLKVDHLSDTSNGSFFISKGHIIHSYELKWMSSFQYNLGSYPWKLAMLYGRKPENRIALVEGRMTGTRGNMDGYFCFLYPY